MIRTQQTCANLASAGRTFAMTHLADALASFQVAGIALPFPEEPMLAASPAWRGRAQAPTWTAAESQVEARWERWERWARWARWAWAKWAWAKWAWVATLMKQRQWATPTSL